MKKKVSYGVITVSLVLVAIILAVVLGSLTGGSSGAQITDDYVIADIASELTKGASGDGAASGESGDGPKETAIGSMSEKDRKAVLEIVDGRIKKEDAVPFAESAISGDEGAVEDQLADHLTAKDLIVAVVIANGREN